MNTKCLNAACSNTVPMHQRRQWGGCCSRACQLVVTRVVPSAELGLQPHALATPTPTVYRKNARQNWKGTGDDRR